MQNYLPMKSATFVFVLLLTAFGFVLLGNLGGWSLKGADEPRYAQIAREMRETGQFLVPHLNAEIYPDKPPLLFWLMSVAAIPHGDVSAFAARLPSAAAGLGLILLTYIFACRLFDNRTGLLAAGILFCCEQFFSTTISAHFDTLLAFWITLALLLFYIGYTRQASGRNFMLGAYGAMGAALLTKGPVGLLIPLSTMLLYVLVRKEFSRIKDLRIGTGLLIAVGCIVAWLIPACLTGGEEYTQNILFKQTFGRAVDSFAHKAPFYYYLAQFPIDFLPWTIFVPAAVAHGWKHRAEWQKNILLPLIWFIFTFGMFSLVSGKRNLYLLPLYPAASMLIAKFFTAFFLDEKRYELLQSKLFMAPYYTLALALLIAGAGGVVLLIGNIGPAQYLAAQRWLVFAASCAALFTGFIFIRRRRNFVWLQQMPLAVIACTAIIYGLGSFILLPAMAKTRPEQAFCETIRTIISPEDKVYTTFQPAFFNYFLHRYPIPELQELDEVKEIIYSSEKTYCLAKDTDYDRLPEDIKSRITILEKSPIGHRTVYLLVNTGTR